LKSSQYDPYELGLHTCYNDNYKKKQYREVEQIYKGYRQCGLFFETQKHEVGIASNRRSSSYGELVPGSSTHCPSRHGNRLCL